jgi:hypothetical protein
MAQLRLQWRRMLFRLVMWWERQLPQHPQREREVAALQMLIMGLTLIVLFQGALLILAVPR